MALDCRLDRIVTEMQGLAQISAGRVWPAIIFVVCALLGCAQSVPVTTASSADAVAGSTSSSSAPPVSSPTTAALALQGTPATTVVAGTPYAFQPTVSQSATSVTYTINNRPSWAVFDTSTGELDGTPPLTSVGTTANITIMASNGLSAATIGPFNITVTAAPASPPPTSAKATLTWVAPTVNTDGTPLTDLAGYHIYYGMNPAQLPLEVILNGAALTTYVVNGLTAGVYYFAVTAFSSQGTESVLSDVVTKTI